jgi:Peptidase family M28
VNVRLLAGVLAAQLLIVALLIAWAAAGRPDFGLFGAGTPAAPHPDAAALADVRRIVAFGPRPAGSPASRRLAAWLRARLPHGRYEAVAGGLRNVVGDLPGRAPAIVLGAHYDTKDIPGFVGANDGAGGTAMAVQVARTLRRPRHTVKVVLFDGEESPRGTPDGLFAERGLRGSKVAAVRYRDARAMVLLDFVANKRLRIPREGYSSPELWSRLRAAARAVGSGRYFPAATQGSIEDDHLPFLEQGVAAIDLIDFEFPCWHRRCDDLSAVSRRSLDASGEAVLRFVASL